jgi:hypothetical protein
VQVSEVVVVVVVVKAAVIDLRGSEARGSQSVDHRVGRAVALEIRGLSCDGGVSRRG